MLIASVGLGVSAVAPWFLTVVRDRTQHRRFRDRLTIAALESHVARLWRRWPRSSTTNAPTYLDRLSGAPQPGGGARSHVYVAILDLRMGLTARCDVGIAGVDPPGEATSLAVFALPTVLTSTWRPGVERAAEERGRGRPIG